MSSSPWLLICNHGFWLNFLLPFDLHYKVFPVEHPLEDKRVKLTDSASWIWSRGLSSDNTSNGTNEGQMLPCSNELQPFLYFTSILSKGEIFQVYPKVILPFLLQIYCCFSLALGMCRLPLRDFLVSLFMAFKVRFACLKHLSASHPVCESREISMKTFFRVLHQYLQSLLSTPVFTFFLLVFLLRWRKPFFFCK